MRMFSCFFVLLAVVSASADGDRDFSDPHNLNYESMRCAQLALKSDNIQQLSELGKFVEKHFLGKNDILNSLNTYEANFLKNNPSSALVIKNSACRAWALSEVVCASDEQVALGDEEGDAIRHFLFTAFLACSRGKKFAEQFMITHEGEPPWDISSKMDIHNNYVAINWATPARCRLVSDEKKFVAVALKKLANKELITILEGKSHCANPVERIKILDKYASEQFSSVVSKYHIEMRKLETRCQ